MSSVYKEVDKNGGVHAGDISAISSPFRVILFVQVYLSQSDWACEVLNVITIFAFPPHRTFLFGFLKLFKGEIGPFPDCF